MLQNLRHLAIIKSTGVWRSLVARAAGGREVAGSNPVAPISFKKRVSANSGDSFLHTRRTDILCGLFCCMTNALRGYAQIPIEHDYLRQPVSGVQIGASLGTLRSLKQTWRFDSLMILSDIRKYKFFLTV